MKHNEQRKRARAILAGSQCLSPASVFDPLSARVAETVGYELGLLSGSISSSTTLAAPDLAVLTLTEFADQIRRIMRVSNLCLLVDADNGYGNALNVMRTVQELEHAGVSILGIEDTVLPTGFGQKSGTADLVSKEEMIGKLRAAIAAREDPDLIIAARTAGLRSEGIQQTVARAKAYAAVGVDAIFVVEAKSLKEIAAVHSAVDIPLIVGSGPLSIEHKSLATLGTRIVLQGHQTVNAIVKALFEVYNHLHAGGAPNELKITGASRERLESLVHLDQYKDWQSQFM